MKNEHFDSATVSLDSRDALLIVDVQKDFCPGGNLAVPDGDRVVPVLNAWIDAAIRRNVHIIASRDWHPPGHVSFKARGGPWPSHCIAETDGAAFHPDLELPDDTHVVSKGQAEDHDQYSAFDDTGLAAELSQRDVERIWVGGLALEVCVRETVLDALNAGFEVHLSRDGTKAIDREQGRKALGEMRVAGAIVEEHEHVA